MFQRVGMIRFFHGMDIRCPVKGMGLKRRVSQAAKSLVYFQAEHCTLRRSSSVIVGKCFLSILLCIFLYKGLIPAVHTLVKSRTGVLVPIWNISTNPTVVLRTNSGVSLCMFGRCFAVTALPRKKQNARKRYSNVQRHCTAAAAATAAGSVQPEVSFVHGFSPRTM